MSIILKRIEENPVIAALKNVEDIDAVIESPVTTVFLLHADIFNIKSLVDKIKNCNKSVFIHIDFLEGIGKDNKAIDYIGKVINPSGIITTKSNSIKYAKENGIFTIQRFFLVDGLSFETTKKAVKAIQPDMIEILPAVMPRVIKKICDQVQMPVIAGGLIENKEDIIEILKVGAMGVSTGKKQLWSL